MPSKPISIPLFARVAPVTLAALAVLGLFASCTSSPPINLDPVRDKPLVLASDPPGARVVIDHRDSGWVTPCVLDLENGNSYLIEFTYPGYLTSRRLLDNSTDTWAVLWQEMYTNQNVWRFPLWLGFEDFFLGVKVLRGQSPSRIYVRMKRSADQ